MHLGALTKKKILMQIRDRKTLAVDTIFPILLVVIGLALATVAIFKEGQPRVMSPLAIYPTPIPLMYNADAKHAQLDDITRFINGSVRAAGPAHFVNYCPAQTSADAQNWQSGVYGLESGPTCTAPTVPIKDAGKIGLKEAVK